MSKPRGISRRNFSREQVLAAIDGSGGIVSAVAKRLGCDWNTARKYINLWETTKKAFEDERNRLLDMAEATVFKAIKGGDVQTAKWVLSRLGRSRGYGDAVDVQAQGRIRIVLTWDGENDDG